MSQHLKEKRANSANKTLLLDTMLIQMLADQLRQPASAYNYRCNGQLALANKCDEFFKFVVARTLIVYHYIWALGIGDW